MRRGKQDIRVLRIAVTQGYGKSKNGVKVYDSERDLAQMPHFKSLLSEGTGTLRARTVFPSVSAPAWCAVLCSQGPPESGILGNEWTPESSWTLPSGLVGQAPGPP
eukprot:s22_g5.t1